MSLEFYVGAQVVCVNDQWVNRDYDEFVSLTFPILNGIYTIRGIDGLNPYDDTAFYLEEIVNPILPGINVELSFYYWHFKPVKKTNIEAFTSILKKVPKKETKIMRTPELV